MDDKNLTITIPMPSDIPRARGVNSTGRFNDSLRVRMSQADRELIEGEAELLGMSYSMFVRWCAIYAAAALRRRRDGERVEVDP